MLKKVIALSTAAMILLTPMSASAVTWRQIASGLQTSNTFKEDKLTVTKDGDTYTFTGGKWLLNKPTEVISETEEAEKVPEPLPKKKTTRKKTASKTAEE